MPKLSILIVSWNQAKRLQRCLQSVLAALPQAEVVVVDNGSSPPLQVPSGVKLVRSEINLGYAAGNNLGWQACTGDYVLLLNNDTFVTSATPIDALVRWLDEHKSTAMTQAKLLRPDGRLDACGEMLSPSGLLYHRFYHEHPTPEADKAVPVFGAKAACALVRKSAIADVGNILFRPEFFCYYEDMDLCHRFWLAGYEVWYVPTKTPILHEESVTAKTQIQRDVWRRYLSNMLTSAFDLWRGYGWCRLGIPLLCTIFLGSLVKRVHPRILNAPRAQFVRRRSDRDLLGRVLVHPSLRTYIATIKRICHSR